MANSLYGGSEFSKVWSGRTATRALYNKTRVLCVVRCALRALKLSSFQALKLVEMVPGEK